MCICVYICVSVDVRRITELSREKKNENSKKKFHHGGRIVTTWRTATKIRIQHGDFGDISSSASYGQNFRAEQKMATTVNHQQFFFTLEVL